MSAGAAPGGDVREYRIPEVNPTATHFTELINWGREQITDPPLTVNLSDEEISVIAEEPLKVHTYLSTYQVHSEGLCVDLTVT